MNRVPLWALAVFCASAVCALSARTAGPQLPGGFIADKAALDRLFDGASSFPGLAETLPQPAEGPGLTGLSAEVLAALQRGESAAREGKVWPGFSLFSQPIMVYEPGRGAALIGHPSPPPGFRAVPSGGPTVFWADGDPVDLRAPFEFHMDVGGRDTFVYRAETGAASGRTAATIARERFHVLQERGFKGRLRYPPVTETGAEDLALARLEHRALRLALEGAGARRAEAGRWFVALRRARYALGSPYRPVEEVEERHEGMARYVEYRLAPVMSGGPRAQELMLKELKDPVRLERMGKWRSYTAGAAQGFLLDSAGVSWKEAVAGGAPPFSLTQGAYPVSAAEQDAVLVTARSTLNYATALREAEAEVVDFRREKAHALARYRAQPGWELQVRPPGSGCGFSASGSVYVLDDGSWFITQVESLSCAVPGFSLHMTDRPGISGEEWRFFVTGPLELRIDGRTAALAAGKTAFQSLAMRAPGFELGTTRPGRLVYDGRCLRLEWDEPAAGLSLSAGPWETVSRVLDVAGGPLPAF
ncbi:MAG: hypothetical protein HY926_11935 [Elusimicrobia bacterium]|nr:hypothetical protein [Elusimicrobiota bacterium]